MATLLITGGAGFIGSNFIRYWFKEHPRDRIINFDLLTYAGNRDNLRDVEYDHDNQYHFIQGDITDLKTVSATFQKEKPDIIVNFAAESHNSRGVVDPGLFFRTNVLGTQILLEAAYKCGVPRFHHISTCEVYGDLSLDSTESFTEKSPYLPRTPYNASKAGADMAVRAYYHTFGLPVTISNCSNNYGPYQFPEKIIPHFTICALQEKSLPLYKSSGHKREWLHTSDHCRAIDLILQKGKIGETYNIGSGIEADIETIANTVIETIGCNPALKTYVSDRPGHDRRYLLDCTKIREKLGWEPQIPFQKGLKETILWYKEHESWWKPLLMKLDINERTWTK
ncbi:dTDP-glucose 4,6-dehydratase [Candidatus Peregrinibacteria bacterium]|nr:dTDP-glucose 4,6-dehydratase [Candidatus Peregrinibacteria bacterium]